MLQQGNASSAFLRFGSPLAEKGNDETRDENNGDHGNLQNRNRVVHLYTNCNTGGGYRNSGLTGLGDIIFWECIPAVICWATGFGGLGGSGVVSAG